jgi:hypothetical protein
MRLLERIIDLFTLNRDIDWEVFDDSKKYTIMILHNGKRPLFQILNLNGKKWQLVGRPLYSAVWAEQKIIQLRTEQ